MSGRIKKITPRKVAVEQVNLGVHVKVYPGERIPVEIE